MDDHDSVLTERILSRFEIDESTGCWLWRGTIQDGGYGTITFMKKTRLVHREAYRLLVGSIPNATIDHLCRVRHCINPEHLESVSHRVNLLRGIGVAAINAAKTHCKLGHEFSVKNTSIRPGRMDRGSEIPWRACLACQKLSREFKRITAAMIELADGCTSV